MQNLSCENEFYLYDNKNHFHKKGFALGLVLKQRLAASRKRPILPLLESLSCNVLFFCFLLFFFSFFTVSFSCGGKPDGTYPNPSDCTKYYICNLGVKYEFSCPTGLLFSTKIQICAYPGNVNC